jgi:hypothetical protein
MMVANGEMNMDDINPGPRYSVNVDGQEVPKFQPDENGEGGNLLIEPGDIMGGYDYIPDIETMRAPSDTDVEKQMTSLTALLTNPAITQGLMQEGVKPKYKDIIVKGIEATKIIKDAESLFEEIKQQPVQNGNPTIPGGAISPEAGQPDQGNVPNGGVATSVPPLPENQNQPFMG